MSYSPFKLPTDWTVNTMDAENKTVAAWSSCKLEDEAFFFFFSCSSKQVMGEVLALSFSWRSSSSCSGRIIGELHE